MGCVQKMKLIYEDKKQKINSIVFNLKGFQYNFNHYPEQMCAYVSFKENVSGLKFFQLLEMFFSQRSSRFGSCIIISVLH